MQTLTDMPVAFSAGTTLSYTRSNGDFPATQFTSKLWLAGAASGGIAGVASGDSHVFTIPASGGAFNTALPAGVYRWAERYTRISDAFVFEGDVGYVTIKPSVAAASGSSLQLRIEKRIALMEDRLEGRLAPGADMEQYGADAMHVMKIPYEQLESHLAQAKEQLRSIAAGGTLSRQVLVTFPGIGFRS